MALLECVIVVFHDHTHFLYLFEYVLFHKLKGTARKRASTKEYGRSRNFSETYTSCSFICTSFNKNSIHVTTQDMLKNTFGLPLSTGKLKRWIAIFFIHDSYSDTILLFFLDNVRYYTKSK